MTNVKCPNCGTIVKIDICKCVDEEGEVHICPKCKYYFRWVEK